MFDPRQDQLIGLRAPRRPESGRTITMTSSTKRRLAWRIGAVLGAAAASATLTGGAPAGQALELIGLQGNTLSYSVTWRGIGTPAEADIHAGVSGVDGPVAVPLFTTPH